MLVSRHTRRRPRAPGGCVLLTWSFALQASWYGEQHVVCGRCRRHRFLLCAVRLLQRPIQHIRELVILPGRTQNRGREASLRQPLSLLPSFEGVGVLLALRGTGANTCAYDPITLQNNKTSLTKHYTRLRPLADGNRWNIVQKHTSSESLLYLSVDSAPSDVIALFQWTSGPSRVRKPLYSVLYQIVEWQLAFKGSLRRPKGRWRSGQSSSV